MDEVWRERNSRNRNGDEPFQQILMLRINRKRKKKKKKIKREKKGKRIRFFDAVGIGFMYK